jgi:DNA-binding beta-propeller fold protein YncE
MDAVAVYVVSATIAASAVTPVDTHSHVAGPSIAIGGGAQSIAVTPNGKMIYVPNSVLHTMTPIRTKPGIPAV